MPLFMDNHVYDDCFHGALLPYLGVCNDYRPVSLVCISLPGSDVPWCMVWIGSGEKFQGHFVSVMPLYFSATADESISEAFSFVF